MVPTSFEIFLGSDGATYRFSHLPGAGTAIMSYVATASIHWDAACLKKADEWLLKECSGPCTQGSKALKGLPIAKQAIGMAVSSGASQHGSAGLD